MLIETLNALALLDYPRFEVIVIDNNTKDPAVWQPVEDHCRTLGGRFRFFHVDPLEGYKSGALNYALKYTSPEAEVIELVARSGTTVRAGRDRHRAGTARLP